jgi:tRNA threonylcarbamoyladenosine biosynthesis protein TsaB
MKLLAIDTATEALSAALWHDGEVRSHCERIGRGHAERVLPLVDRLLAEAGWSLGSLDALAFGRGPGAFTGVRIAVSTVQGLAFGAELPVVPVSDLAALGRRLLDLGAGTGATQALACLDARMGEVYAALVVARPDGGVDLAWEELLRPAAVTAARLPGDARLVMGGHGFAAYPELAARFPERLAALHADCLPHAADIVRLAALEMAAGKAIAAELAQPVYLRDDVATRSGRRP